MMRAEQPADTVEWWEDVNQDLDIRPKMDQSEADFYLLDANRRFNFSFQEKQT